jgi:hypothetical protein
LVAGLSYDHLTFPVNNDAPPISAGTSTRDLLAPQAGFLLVPWKGGFGRGAYSRSLSGLYFDNSLRLEPTHLAGFTQDFRSLLPESVAGLVPGTEFDSVGLAFDQVFDTGTYLGVQAEWLHSDGERVVGVLTNSLPVPLPDSPSSTSQTLDFEERDLSVYALQRLGDGVTLGARYRFSDAQLATRFPNIPNTAAGLDTLEQDERSTLHHVMLSLDVQHVSGVFGGWQSSWFHQTNDGYEPERPGDDFWQHHVALGYRFPQWRAEITLRLLNITDQDYRLSPLNAHVPLARRRTLTCTLRLNF